VKEKRILLIDDDELILDTYRRILERNGFHVDTASTGEQAKEQLEKSTYDILLVDIVLPDIPGDRLILDLRLNDNNVPVIVITGFSSYEKSLDTIGLRISDILLKPIDPDELVESINDVFKRL
jgi:DNA-binding response OmpR family regulator